MRGRDVAFQQEAAAFIINEFVWQDLDVPHRFKTDASVHPQSGFSIREGDEAQGSVPPVPTRCLEQTDQFRADSLPSKLVVYCEGIELSTGLDSRGIEVREVLEPISTAPEGAAIIRYPASIPGSFASPDREVCDPLDRSGSVSAMRDCRFAARTQYSVRALTRVGVY
jgi:hypothetical protein